MTHTAIPCSRPIQIKAPVTELQLSSIRLQWQLLHATGCTEILYFSFMEDIIIKHRTEIYL